MVAPSSGTPPASSAAPKAPAAPAAPPSHEEPREIDSMDALTALMGAAYAAQQRGDLGEVGRIMSRIFRELSTGDMKQAVKIMTDSWLGGLKGQVAAPELARLEEFCQQGMAAAAEGRLIDASRCFAQTRAAVGNTFRVNPAMDWLTLGAMQAGKLTVDDEKREAIIKDLIARASTLLVQPGKTTEALDLFRQVMALLPNPPLLERDRVRAERIRKLLDQYPQGTAPPSKAGEPATFLPPPGSLSPDAWNQLGERLSPTDAKQALICFDRAVEGDPTVGLYWVNKADAMLTTGAPPASVAEAYQKGAQRSPGEIRAWAGLAAVLQQAGHYETAMQAWDGLLRLKPGAAVAQEQRAFCSRASALDAEGAGWDAPAWIAKGLSFYEAKEWALADVSFERALALSPRNLSALCGKGVTFYKWAVQTKASSSADAAAMRFNLAAQYLREALELDPTNEAARTVLGLCEAAVK